MPEEIEIETAYPTFKFSENGEPAKWLFIYLDLPRTEGFGLEFAFVTDGNGRLGTWEIPEASAILERGEVYNLFYDYRPWTEEELATLTAEDCQEVTIGDEIQLEPKSGDVEVELKDIRSEPLANFLYRLHLPDGGTIDGATDGSGILSESSLPDGIVRLQMFTQEDTDSLLIEEEENIEELSDNEFLVEVDWLRRGVVCLCRGGRYPMRIFENWCYPWTFEFKHWKLLEHWNLVTLVKEGRK